MLFFIEISTRRIVFWNLSQHPSGAWVSQQFRNLSVSRDLLPRYRDSKFSSEGDRLLRSMGTRPVRSPDLNAHAERWVRTLREECLDRIIVVSERHLRWVLDEFIAYYNERRPHRWKGLGVLSGKGHFPQVGKVVRRCVLGGVVNDYFRKAARHARVQRRANLSPHVVMVVAVEAWLEHHPARNTIYLFALFAQLLTPTLSR